MTVVKFEALYLKTSSKVKTHRGCPKKVTNGCFTTISKGGFKSENTGEFLLLQNKYSKSLS